MHIKLLLLSLIIICTCANAQSLSPQVFASAGGFYSKNQGSFSVTIGEAPAIQTVSNSSINLILKQGFHQRNILASVIKPENVTIEFKTYPNPVQKIKSLMFQEISFLLPK